MSHPVPSEINELTAPCRILLLYVPTRRGRCFVLHSVASETSAVYCPVSCPWLAEAGSPSCSSSGSPPGVPPEARQLALPCGTAASLEKEG